VRRTGRRSRRAAGAAALGLLGALLGACGGRVVASSSQQIYFQVPPNWRIYDQKALAQGPAQMPALSTNPPDFYAEGSANPKPHPSDVFTASRYPWLIALVRKLSLSEQQQMSLEGLSDVLVNVDALSSQGFNVQVVSPPQLMVKGTMRGTVASFNFGGAMEYTQETWVNSATNKVWVLVAGCSSSCFRANQSIISRVIQSFYVADRGKQ
jgi:hypothetical protein